MYVYSEGYDLDWAEHVFPTEKYRLLYHRLRSEGLANDQNVSVPEPAADQDVCLVHDQAYLRKLCALTKNPGMAAFWGGFEAPLTRKTLQALYLCTGGTILAARKALAEKRCWMNLCGGFHHAFRDRGEGFCFINDVAVAAKVMRRDAGAQRVVIIDCDLHQGNGTAKIFESDSAVFTFSIHQEDLYPPKERSDIDIGLDKGAGDDEYLSAMKAGLDDAFRRSRFDLVFYLAGADPYAEDKLGALQVTKNGLRMRDWLVLDMARHHGVPVATVLAGGYAKRTQDVVDIHTTTAGIVADANNRLEATA